MLILHCDEHYSVRLQTSCTQSRVFFAAAANTGVEPTTIQAQCVEAERAVYEASDAARVLQAAATQLCTAAPKWELLAAPDAQIRAVTDPHALNTQKSLPGVKHH